MLFAVIGGTVVSLMLTLTIWVHFAASLTVPPKDLRRRWRSGR